MIKEIKKYPELVDPQLRPRYSGIASFFRLPLPEQAAGVDIGIVGGRLKDQTTLPSRRLTRRFGASRR